MTWPLPLPLQPQSGVAGCGANAEVDAVAQLEHGASMGRAAHTEHAGAAALSTAVGAKATVWLTGAQLEHALTAVAGKNAV